MRAATEPREVNILVLGSESANKRSLIKQLIEGATITQHDHSKMEWFLGIYHGQDSSLDAVRCKLWDTTN